MANNCLKNKEGRVFYPTEGLIKRGDLTPCECPEIVKDEVEEKTYPTLPEQSVEAHEELNETTPEAVEEAVEEPPFNYKKATKQQLVDKMLGRFGVVLSVNDHGVKELREKYEELVAEEESEDAGD
jgi:hypothetical protein